MSNDIKELSKSPFKDNDKYDKHFKKLQSIFDKHSDKKEVEKQVGILNDIEELSIKTKEPVVAHVYGSILKENGFEDYASLFFDKAEELGYDINESGTIDLPKDIAKDLLPKIKDKKDQLGKFSVKDLENIMLTNGSDLKLLDETVSELVDMGFDFDNDEDDYTETNETNNTMLADHVTIYWKGQPIKTGLIGSFYITPAAHKKIKDEFKNIISIDFYDDNVTIPTRDISTYRDVIIKMKETEYGNLYFKESNISEAMREATDKEKEVFAYLNDLRSSGVTNMFGASPYIQEEFPELDKSEASNLLSTWMNNFNDEGDYDMVKESIVPLNEMVNMKDKAKEIRKILKREFPKFKFSITSDYKSITVAIMAGPIDFLKDSTRDGHEQLNHYNFKRDFDGEALKVLSRIKELIFDEQEELTYDGDYGSVPNYYGNVHIGKWDRPFVYTGPKEENTVTENNEDGKQTIYIEFLNKDKNFTKDKKYFDNDEQAITWGKKNLGNFHIDMIKDDSLFEKNKKQKDMTNENINENYRAYFKDKMDEFEVESPTELTKDQWEEIDNGWTAEDETNYQTYFKNKMDEFEVESPTELTKEQWDEIDAEWESDAEEKEDTDTEETTEKLDGGLADNMSVDEIAAKHGVGISMILKQLEKGIEVEMEHTDDKGEAEEIAMDHLVESPKYYDELEKKEKEMSEHHLNSKEDKIDLILFYMSDKDKTELENMSDEVIETIYKQVEKDFLGVDPKDQTDELNVDTKDNVGMNTDEPDEKLDVEKTEETDEEVIESNDNMMSFDEFKEAVLESEIEGGFGASLGKQYTLHYLPNDHKFLGKKFEADSYEGAYDKYVSLYRLHNESSSAVKNESKVIELNGSKFKIVNMEFDGNTFTFDTIDRDGKPADSFEGKIETGKYERNPDNIEWISDAPESDDIEEYILDEFYKTKPRIDEGFGSRIIVNDVDGLKGKILDLLVGSMYVGSPTDEQLSIIENNVGGLAFDLNTYKVETDIDEIIELAAQLTTTPEQLAEKIQAVIEKNKDLFEYNEKLRSVTVKYGDGTEITTSMAEHLTDEEIRDYFAVGKEFNIGSYPEENVQPVEEVIINESHKQVMPYKDNMLPWIVYPNAVEKPESKINYQAVQNMVLADSFLSYAYDNVMTGNFYEDMEKMYNEYIEKDDDNKKKLKTFESYTKYQIDETLNKSKLAQTIFENMSEVNEEIKTEIYNTLDKITEYKNSLRDNISISTLEFRNDIKCFKDIDIKETVNSFRDSKITLESFKDDNVLDFNLNATKALKTILESICETVSIKDPELNSELAVVTSLVLLK